MEETGLWKQVSKDAKEEKEHPRETANNGSSGKGIKAVVPHNYVSRFSKQRENYFSLIVQNKTTLTHH